MATNSKKRKTVLKQDQVMCDIELWLADEDFEDLDVLGEEDGCLNDTGGGV